MPKKPCEQCFTDCSKYDTCTEPEKKYLSKDCPDCKGFYPILCKKHMKNKCPACDGEGGDIEPCEKCKGTGRTLEGDKEGMNVEQQFEHKSMTEIRMILTNFHKKACKLPPEWDHMIIDIVGAHLLSLSQSLGNLELCFRRTLQHADEIRKDRKG